MRRSPGSCSSGTTAECRLDAARWRRCANPKTYLGLGLGEHVFRVRARSASGRRSSVNRFTWTISETPPPPPPTITSGPDGSTTSTDATFQFSVADGAAAECRLDGGLWLAVLEPGRLRRPVRRHPRVLRPRGRRRRDGRPGDVSHLDDHVGRDRGADRSLHDVGGPSGPPRARKRRALPLTVTNPYDFPLRVWSLRGHRSRRDLAARLRRRSEPAGDAVERRERMLFRSPSPRSVASRSPRRERPRRS